MAKAAALMVAAGSAATASAYAAQIQSAATQPYTLPQTTTFTVDSATGQSYDIMVFVPKGKPPPEGWPVLYLLDGEDTFAVAAVTARRLARVGARSGVDQGIVVGIGAGPVARRVRDYTPPVAGYAIPAGLPANGMETGGSEAFLDLFADRIMPAVRKKWPVDSTRETLAGHSFGGLLVLHAFLSRPNLVDTAVAISPSLWFGDRLIDTEVDRIETGSPPRRLLIAESDETPPAAMTASSPEATVRRLQNRAPSLEAQFLPLPGQSHGTTFLAAIMPTLKFAFGRTDR